MAKAATKAEIIPPGNEAEPEYRESKPTPRPKRKTRTVSDPERVYVHIDVHSVGVEGFSVSQDDEGDPKHDIKWGADERSWSFKADPQIITHLITHYEFAANHPGGIPLTEDEKLIAEDERKHGEVEVGKLSRALAQMASDKVTAGEAE